MGLAHVAVRAEGYRPQLSKVEVSRTGEVISGVVVRMSPQSDLNGRVLDDAGRPVAGALLFMGNMPQNADRRLEENSVARTDVDGIFVVPASKVSGDALGVFHPEYPVAALILDENQLAGGLIEVTLGSGGRVEGTVTLSGVPVEGVTVYVTEYGGRVAESLEATNGAYEIDRVAEGLAFVQASLTLNSPGEEPLRRSSHVEAEVLNGETTVVDFDFALGTATITGSLVGEDDSFGRSMVWLRLETESGQEHWYLVTQTGRYNFVNVPAGLATLSVVFYESDSSANVVPVEFEVGDGELIEQDLEVTFVTP